jgi:hypothetical protein
MQITFFLFFLPCFFLTCADILLASPLRPRDLTGQNSAPLRPRLRGRSSRLVERGKDPLTFDGCSVEQENEIRATVPISRRRTEEALKFVANTLNTADANFLLHSFLKTSHANAPRYTTWYGQDKDGAGRKTVQRILEDSRKSLDEDTLYDCHTCDKHDTAARVDPAV